MKDINDTHSLRVIPALSGDAGVTKYEIPILKESHSYTFTKFDAGSKVKPHSHDEGQLRIITRGLFNFVVNGETFKDMGELDWIYIPKGTVYSIETVEAGAMVTPYHTSCECMSDRNVKEDFADVDEQDVLDNVSRLQIQTWKYIDREIGVRHVGPMAQDFKMRFNVGASDKVIDLVDANGITLAAIKALNSKLVEKDAQVRALERRLQELEKQSSACGVTHNAYETMSIA